MSEMRDEYGTITLPPELLARMMPDPGSARQNLWDCEDGWYVVYTTERIKGGPHDGKFLVQEFKPVGPGARTNPKEWVEVYRREFSTRKAAKARWIALYRKHSPKRSAQVKRFQGEAVK